LLSLPPSSLAHDAPGAADLSPTPPMLRLYLHGHGRLRMDTEPGASNISFVDTALATPLEFPMDPPRKLHRDLLLDARRDGSFVVSACLRQVSSNLLNMTMRDANMSLTATLSSASEVLASVTDTRFVPAAFPQRTDSCEAPTVYELVFRVPDTAARIPEGQGLSMNLTFELAPEPGSTGLPSTREQWVVKVFLGRAEEHATLLLPVVNPVNLDVRTEANPDAKLARVFALVTSPLGPEHIESVSLVVDGPSVPRNLTGPVLHETNIYRWDWNWGEDGASPGAYTFRVKAVDRQAQVTTAAGPLEIAAPSLLGFGETVATTVNDEATAPFTSDPVVLGAIALVVLAAILLAALLALSRRRESNLAKLLELVDETYAQFRGEPEGCRRELVKLSTHFAGEAKAGRLAEPHRAKLQARIDRYLRSLEGDLALLERALAGRLSKFARDSTLRIEAGGTIFGKYEVERLLSTGAFGRTYLASDKILRRRVVVKELLAEWRADAKILESFIREAQIAGQTNHPNVVTVYDIERVGKDHYIIMEYVDGGSVEDLLSAKKRLAVPDAVEIVDQTLAGLAKVHAQNIYHRDVKPSNILLTKEGTAKIADFGIAHTPSATATALRLSATGVQPGTLLYMSPEQAKGEAVDAGSDLYSVSAVLYQLVTGAHYLDFEGKTDYQARQAIIHDAPRLPIPGQPAWLTEILAKGLAKDRKDRWKSADELRRALRRHVPTRAAALA
ncbi:MAG: serine/threonine-protein kinase, partial [Methanobacteriota archaeon]